MRDPILITGCARSGTSMVAGAVHLCGAFGGIMRKPNRFNEKGMFENDAVVNALIKPYLRSHNLDPLGQFPLPILNRLRIPNDWKERIEKIMLNEGYKEGPWMYKGAKMCLIWPVLHYTFPNAKWIIVRRRTADIVHSCVHTKFMRAFRNEDIQRKVYVKNEREGWLWWVHQHEKRFVEMITEGLNCKVIWPHRMVRGDYQQMMETIEWLGLSWKTEVLNFVDPKLWHARAKSKGGDNG